MSVNGPDCDHDPTVRVSSHEDLEAARRMEESHASIYSCEDPVCIAEAKHWVQGVTARPAVVVRLPRRVAP